MNPYDVYNLFDVTPESGSGATITDSEGAQYLDFYGGHAVISIGHSHPTYVNILKGQLDKLGFYSNSIINPLQGQLAKSIGLASGLNNYNLFLVNSGAEANENALKLASFYNQRKRVIAMVNGFHGRTSAAINVTHAGRRYQAPINTGIEVEFFDQNNIQGICEALEQEVYSSVIIEAIQGIGGLTEMTDNFLQSVEACCRNTDTILIMDEIQCGYGRSGDFFAFQKAGIKPDMITLAKGMGNGFPVGGVIIDGDKFPASKGSLGSTFGGNHLACAAALSVLQVFEDENIIANVRQMGNYLKSELIEIEQIVDVKGRGLMLGAQFAFPVAGLRRSLVSQQKVFTGSSIDPNQLRILPPLNIVKDNIDLFINRLRQELDSGKYKM